MAFHPGPFGLGVNARRKRSSASRPIGTTTAGPLVHQWPPMDEAGPWVRVGPRENIAPLSGSAEIGVLFIASRHSLKGRAAIVPRAFSSEHHENLYVDQPNREHQKIA
jgi:hypothetical protein